jgi:hypothetical protein
VELGISETESSNVQSVQCSGEDIVSLVCAGDNNGNGDVTKSLTAQLSLDWSSQARSFRSRDREFIKDFCRQAEPSILAVNWANQLVHTIPRTLGDFLSRSPAS